MIRVTTTSNGGENGKIEMARQPKEQKGCIRRLPSPEKGAHDSWTPFLASEENI